MALQFEQLPARNGNGNHNNGSRNGNGPDYGPALPYTPVPFAGVIQKTDLPMEWRAATLPRPPTVSRAASPTAKSDEWQRRFFLKRRSGLVSTADEFARCRQRPESTQWPASRCETRLALFTEPKPRNKPRPYSTGCTAPPWHWTRPRKSPTEPCIGRWSKKSTIRRS